MISALITTHNRLDILRLCLDAIYKQKHMLKEIIVINDGSTDASQDFLERELERGHIEKLIHNPIAKGPAKGRNQGIAVSEGSHTLIMGDDVIFAQNTIERFNHYIDENNLQNDSVLGNIQPWPDNMTAFEYYCSNGGSQFGHYRIPESEKQDAGEQYYYTCNIVSPTKILQENPFDEGFPFARYEDMELSYRLKRRYEHKIHYLSDAISFHYHPTRLKNWLMSFEKWTWAALYYSSKYNEDEDLKEKIGIKRAMNNPYFSFEELMQQIDIINDCPRTASKKKIIAKHSLPEFEISDELAFAFRSLQEFFRRHYYRKHLDLPYLVDTESELDSNAAKDIFLQSIGEWV